VWRGRYGGDEPLFGPLPGVRLGNAIAYEFELPEEYEPRPGRTRLERVFILTDFGVSMTQPCWSRVTLPDGRVVLGVDALVDGPQSWYVDLVELTDNGSEVSSLDLFIDVVVPTDGRHQRLLDLDEFGDAIEAGVLPVDVAVDGLRRWQRFLDSCLHRERDPTGPWPDFPPKAFEELAALPAPLGPVVSFKH
jgi:Protein of unknown function (DUF402)